MGKKYFFRKKSQNSENKVRTQINVSYVAPIVFRTFPYVQRQTEKRRVQPCKHESASWHAGQSVLTLQVNGWKALEETTVSFEN